MKRPLKELKDFLKEESQTFKELYLWIQKTMPDSFFEEAKDSLLLLITRHLIDFEHRLFFVEIHLNRMAIVLCLNSEDADIKVLKNFRSYGIKNYLSFISRDFFKNTKNCLKVSFIYFTEAKETIDKPFSKKNKQLLKKAIQTKNPLLSDEEFNRLMSSMNTRFLNSLNLNLLVNALEMFSRAKTRDTCQYEVFYNSNSLESPSFQIILAWRGAPKYDFLYHIAHIVHHHKLIIRKMNATYIDPYSHDVILIMALGLDGKNGKAAWETADIQEFLKELVTAKYFQYFDLIQKTFVTQQLLSGNLANFLRSSLDFIHQALLMIDPHFYSYQNCEEALCRHPELTCLLTKAFIYKLHPQKRNLEQFKKIEIEFDNAVTILDTGHEINDIRCKNVLLQGMNFIKNILKTNVFQNNKTAFSFRLKPCFLEKIPLNDQQKFIKIPFGVFFIVNKHFLAFHIRFKDISRGGLRTICCDTHEKVLQERNSLFSECYNLAFTQDKKNKDIPEGGSKGVILLNPPEKLQFELPILFHELKACGYSESVIEEKLKNYKTLAKQDFLYQQQRSFIRNLLVLVNGDAKGHLLAKNIVDEYRKPEYLYLGPDENMHDPMIEWIAEYATQQNYKPKSAFISGKSSSGINHKAYGVTSLGLSIYIEEVLKHLSIDPENTSFSLKMTGGPDGDVAGNLLKILIKKHPKTIKILAITDSSGVIFDPNGLNLKELLRLSEHGLTIHFFKDVLLSERGFHLDKLEQRQPLPYIYETLCKKKISGKIKHVWLSGNEMNHLYKTCVHQTVADLFVPAGGRPKSLNKENLHEFLDDQKKPTAKAIIEGANLYLTEEAREKLEALGTLIIKDSSANKTGVICSSYEVLCGLALTEKQFLDNKSILLPEIFELLKEKAKNEAHLLLSTGGYLSKISEEISKRINFFSSQILEYLQNIPLTKDPQDPLIHCFLQYCPKTLRTHFQKELLKNIPEGHKKAIISCFIAAKVVYERGLFWTPSIVDILPQLLKGDA